MFAHPTLKDVVQVDLVHTQSQPSSLLLNGSMS
jgi:hypothetical protein